MNCVNELEIRDIIACALKEDIGNKDITTDALIPKGKSAQAELVAKEDFFVCGMNVASFVFKSVDKKTKFKPLVSEGALVKKGKRIAKVSGKAQSILKAERVALNFLSLLSGISTKVRKFSGAVRPYKVRIVDTRKTIPCLRSLQKYAVRIGGGYNHRMKLDDMFLVKDNHLKLVNLKQLPVFNKKYELEIEVKTISEFKEALSLRPDMIMLDNMSIEEMKEAVRIRNNLSKKPPYTPKLEASGGITLKNVKRVASCGIDLISIGELTHSVDSVDISLEIL